LSRGATLAPSVTKKFIVGTFDISTDLLVSLNFVHMFLCYLSLDMGRWERQID
jgi:hypothetical protein